MNSYAYIGMKRYIGRYEREGGIWGYGGWFYVTKNPTSKTWTLEITGLFGLWQD